MSSRILNIEIHKPDYIGSPRVTTRCSCKLSVQLRLKKNDFQNYLV